ncbi:hypothetical protein N9X61_01005 [Sulfurimonas sp.]|nr:hypothetical protein [Sulfurimonas sp.]
MRLSFRLKHHFFSAFREFFVHHHGSLEFRAKVFALVIAANLESTVESYVKVKEIALKIYDNDEERANLLMLTTKEKVQKVKDNNGLDIDILVANIQKDLKIIPRYAKKINLEELNELILLSDDEDIISYQNNMLEFLNTLKDDTLKKKERQIAKDEETFNSQFAS